MKKFVLLPLAVCIAIAMTISSCSKKDDTITQCTGSLQMVNNSTNPYKVFINGAEAIPSMDGGTVQLISNKAEGAYVIRVLQLSGYILVPTDKTYNGTLTCGATLVTSFP